MVFVIWALTNGGQYDYDNKHNHKSWIPHRFCSANPWFVGVYSAWYMNCTVCLHPFTCGTLTRLHCKHFVCSRSKENMPSFSMILLVLVKSITSNVVSLQFYKEPSVLWSVTHQSYKFSLPIQFSIYNVDWPVRLKYKLWQSFVL